MSDPQDEWYHQPFRTAKSVLVPLKYRHSTIPPMFLQAADGPWLRRYKWRTARRRNERPGPSSWTRFEKARAINKAIAAAARRPPTCDPREHEWNNDGNDPTHCLKCGMSFTRHIFMECE